MKTVMLLSLLFVGCGGLGKVPCLDRAYPNPTPEGLCCDDAWQWCLAPDGGKVGAP